MTYASCWDIIQACEDGFDSGFGLVAAGAAAVVAALPRILNITVPQVGHLPLMAFRPFFMVSSTPSAMGFLALHLTQYPSDIKNLPSTLHASNGLHRLPINICNVNSKRNNHKLNNLQHKITRGLGGMLSNSFKTVAKVVSSFVIRFRGHPVYRPEPGPPLSQIAMLPADRNAPACS
jgi:hypothetical protein